ncbi:MULTISPECIES: hypothetical protein [Paraburkholderia]|uniref:Oxaloacetate decarboxylase, gamma chain n=1 Tax=Paraburkholderia tuberum TaxID=157910 RepID=A0A1H1EZN4_9BURK|nr:MULTISPECIES: hypothetical protein [Paraburkholderia]MBB5410630.1 putative membrane protein AbrB (regulator of aidB expression) [Paraburkholderia sp. HC6.4b]MBB5452839.1 putative membrane protein AbrB (regulator of aidB expression) [Paraburkholderia sp. Kb1A]SDQ94098.1 hypothetical protein SAMN05445850_2198 [Paraburkholderia tuberum]
MDGISWITLILATMIGGFLFAMIGVVLLALLLGNVSDRLSSNDETRQDS